MCTETLERVSPPVHISNLSYCHTTPLEVCARGGADFNGQFFFMRRYVSEIDFRKLPELRGHVPHASWPRPRRTQRVAHTRRARWGGARGSVWAGPYRATAPLAAATAHGVGDRGTQQSDCPKRPKTRGRRPAGGQIVTDVGPHPPVRPRGRGAGPYCGAGTTGGGGDGRLGFVTDVTARADFGPPTIHSP